MTIETKQTTPICRRFAVLLFLTIHLPVFLEAQGLMLTTEAADTLPYLPYYHNAKGTESSSDNSLKNYCPTPYNQGSTRACIPFACGYGAYTIQQAVKNKWSTVSITQNAYSAAYLFNQVKQGNNNLMFADVFKVMKEKGICPAASFSNKYILEGKFPDEKIINVAKKNLIPGDPEPLGAKLKESYKGMKLPKEGGVAAIEAINQIKACLAQKRAVILGAATESDFATRYKKQAYWQPQSPLLVYHAMLIIGYDDASKSFELMNSYGTDWGIGGFIRLNYADLWRVFREAHILPASNTKGWDIDPAGAPIIDPELREDVGLFTLKNYEGMLQNAVGLDSSKFVRTAISYNKGRQLYETKPKNWQKNAAFKLFAQQIPDGRYLYIFSLDPRDTLTVHWPPDARWAETDKRTSAVYAQGLEGKAVSAFILSDEVLLDIPAPNEFLQTNYAGEEQLIALVADRPITDFRQRLDRFKLAKGGANERLDKVFGDVLIPRNRLLPTANVLSVSRFAYEPKGWVVPIVLSLKID